MDIGEKLQQDIQSLVDQKYTNAIIDMIFVSCPNKCGFSQNPMEYYALLDTHTVEMRQHHKRKKIDDRYHLHYKPQYLKNHLRKIQPCLYCMRRYNPTGKKVYFGVKTNVSRVIPQTKGILDYVE